MFVNPKVYWNPQRIKKPSRIKRLFRLRRRPSCPEMYYTMTAPNRIQPFWLNFLRKYPWFNIARHSWYGTTFRRKHKLVRLDYKYFILAPLFNGAFLMKYLYKNVIVRYLKKFTRFYKYRRFIKYY